MTSERNWIKVCKWDPQLITQNPQSLELAFCDLAALFFLVGLTRYSCRLQSCREIKVTSTEVLLTQHEVKVYYYNFHVDFYHHLNLNYSIQCAWSWNKQTAVLASANACQVIFSMSLNTRLWDCYIYVSDIFFIKISQHALVLTALLWPQDIKGIFRVEVRVCTVWSCAACTKHLQSGHQHEVVLCGGPR